MEEQVLQSITTQQYSNVSGLVITPIFTNIKPGESYILSVTNTTKQQTAVNFEASVFEILGSERRIYPNEMVKINGESLNKFVSTDQTNLVLDPGQKKSVRVSYLKEADGYLLGVRVNSGRTTTGGTRVSSTVKGASVIVKTEIGQAELAQIQTRLEVEPQTGFKLLGQKFSLTNNYTAKTIIQNDSDVILKPAGIVVLYTNDKRITAEQLTTDMIKGLYPGEKFTTQKNLTDDRDFWKNLGTSEIKQELKINGNELVDKENIYVIPYQLLLAMIILLIGSIGAYISYTYYKKHFRKRTR